MICSSLNDFACSILFLIGDSDGSDGSDGSG